MSDLETLLFENPLPLSVLLGVAALVAILAFWRRRARKLLAVAIVSVVAAVGLFGLAALVTTERERLAATLDELVAAVRAGDVAAVAGLVDESYADGVHTRSTALDALERTRRRIGLTDLQLTSTEIHIFDDEALVAGGAVFTLDDPMAVYDRLPSRWRIWWVRRPEGWRVSSSSLDEPAGVPGAPRGP